MVALRSAGPASLAGRAWAGIRRDLEGFRGSLRPPAPPAPGLHTFRVAPPGGQVRIHLRVAGDGAAVLFVDVTDVVHLNPSAAALAFWALDGVPAERAVAGLRAASPDAPALQVRREAEAMYRMIERFSRPGEGCPTCDLQTLRRTAPFSTPIDAPFKADLALTYGCNNECPHCYNEADRLGMASLDLAGWRQVLDRLHALGVPHVIFTGGEATLHPDLPALVAHADRLGLVVGLNSNGRKLAHAPYMRSLAEAGLNHVQITLGSCRPELHDAMMGARSFDQTVAGIRSALASGVHVISNTTLMRCNMGHAEAIIDFLHELGLRTFAMNGMIYSGGGFADPEAIPEGELAPLLVRVRDHARARGMRFLWYTPTEYCRMSPVELEIGAKRCNAGEYSICVEPNGDVLPCQSFYVSAGNILRDPWERIWQGALFRSFRDREIDPRGTGLPEKCWECPDLPLCGGGCRIEREAREGRRASEGGGCASGGCGGGGCSTGGCGSAVRGAAAATPRPAMATAGFIPVSSLVRTSRRTSGRMERPAERLGVVGADPHAATDNPVPAPAVLIGIDEIGLGASRGRG